MSLFSKIKPKKVENCPICGRVMNKKKLKDGRKVYKHSCIHGGSKYSIVIYITKQRKGKK